MNSKVSRLPLIGPAFVSRLEKLEIRTIRDLLYHIPFRYDDFSIISKISRVQPGETVTVQATIKEIRNIFTPGGFVLQKAVVFDESGEMDITWFNQRFLTQTLHKGNKVTLSGKAELSGHKVILKSPEYEIFREFSLHTGRMVPVYSETAGISSKWLRARVYATLQMIKNNQLNIPETLEENVKKDESLMDIKEALWQIHFPDTQERADLARRRLAFDELLWSQLESKIRRKSWEVKTVGHKFKITEIRDKLKVFVDNLPFQLTPSQKKVINEIFQDLAKETPMNRLLQGDVGSGKTVVAAIAMLAAYLNGYQSALMAPTEILANQHQKTISKLLSPLQIKVGIATGSKKDYTGFDVVVGTHALLSDNLTFKKLGLIVIDEQHRFGVEQRAILSGKGDNPHILTMTATPIPRTVALTLYGDLDMSVLTDMPKDRLPVKTWVVPENKREAAYKWISSQKTQTFIICPFIDESETMQTVKAATTEFERLKKIFKNECLGLIHGKMKDKDKILAAFENKKTDILVATPVVEVGIDIPAATIMVIEAADRFGLAQLHQLRGRVGRGEKQSYCLLFAENGSPQAINRLKYLEKLNNGLKLSEIDFKFRGPGQRFGTVQHGKWGLSIASFDDLELIEKTNLLARKISKNPSEFPLLQEMITKSTIN